MDSISVATNQHAPQSRSVESRRTQALERAIEEAWRTVADVYHRAVPAAGSAERGAVERELLFCLLGGYGISYEHGRSAAATISELQPFSTCWQDDDLFEAVVQALLQPQFEPRKSDGSFRRYRFPRRKASIIVKARRWLLENPAIHERLMAINLGDERRDLLRSCPGVGMKTASWVLRNIGLGEDLAIVDVHVLRALSDTGRVPKDTRLPRDYDSAEHAFLEWCNELNASPSAFDLFVWDWQRGALRI